MKLHYSIIFWSAILLTVLWFAASKFLTGNSLHLLIALSFLPPLFVVSAAVLLNDRDVFSPLYLLLYLLLISVPAKVIFLSYFDYSSYARLVSLDGRSIEILEFGLYGVVLGIFSFLVGYCFYVNKNVTDRVDFKINRHMNFENISINYNSSKYVLFLLICFVVFVYCFVVFCLKLHIFEDLSRGIFSTYRSNRDADELVRLGSSSLGYLRWGAMTLPQVVVLATFALRLINGVRFRTGTRVMVIVLGVGSTLLPILSSARLELIYFFLMIGMISHYYRRRFKPAKLVILALLMIAMTGTLGEVRKLNREAQSDGVSFQSAFEKILGGAYFMDIAKTSVVLDSVPRDVDYLYGKSFTLFLVAPIPRAMWPEKPAIRISAFVGDEIFNRPDNSGIPPGFIAESYMNFGLLGIVGCLLLLGALCGFVYKKFLAAGRIVFAPLWYTFSIVILTLTLLSGDLTVAISQSVRFGVVLLIVNYFGVSKLNRRRNY